MRYPTFGEIRADGENIIELAYGPSVRCTRAHVVVAGNAIVKLNGRVIEPMGSNEAVTVYDLCAHCLMGTPDGFPGGIGSLTVEGDAVYYAMCSLFDPPPKRKSIRLSYLDGYKY